jgi:hypothetical protein
LIKVRKYNPTGKNGKGHLWFIKELEENTITVAVHVVINCWLIKD